MGRIDDQDVIVSGVLKSVRIWDSLTGEPMGNPLRSEWENAVAIGRAGGRDVVAMGCQDTEYESGTHARTCRSAIRCSATPGSGALGGQATRGNPVTGIALGRTGDRGVIVSAGNDGTIRLWDASTGRQVGDQLTGQIGPMDQRGCDGRAGNGDIVAAAGFDEVLVWDASTGQQIGDQLTGRGGESTRWRWAMRAAGT